MPIESRRLLGFAFAGADLLVETDPSGRITLVLGAAVSVLGQNEAKLPGQALADLCTPIDRPLAQALTAGLEEGLRRGPVTLRLAGSEERAVSVMAHRMAGNRGLASLALSRAAPPTVQTGPDGLMSPAGLEALTIAAIDATGEHLEMAMVEFAGLDAACAGLPAAESDLLKAAIAGAVRAESRAGTAAARVSSERFALLRQVGESAEALAGRLTRLACDACAKAPPAAARSLVLDSSAGAQKIGRAVRHALEDFSREGVVEPGAMTLSDAINHSVQKTLARAGDLGAAITERRFQLAFQPVVDLKTGEAHHHEVLVRFEDGDSPFQLIRLAEEFDLIEELDRAIFEQVLERLRDPASGKSRLAVNISGRTIVSDDFAAHAQGLLRKNAALKGRLIFEITESATIHDLPRAEKHIQALRNAGCLVCIDDFGAGAANFSYLQQLTLDIVKIDGRYVRELATNGRDGAMVRHLARMCSELKIRTVAEMVETPQIEAMVREAGVDFAQGYLYGVPAPEPLAPLTLTKPANPAKRKGAVESWR